MITRPKFGAKLQTTINDVAVAPLVPIVSRNEVKTKLIIKLAVCGGSVAK